MLIGLSGYARSGKDTVAEHLINEYKFTQYSFAEPMKQAMYILNPVVGSNSRYRDVVDLQGIDNAKVVYPEIRRLLQVFGTEVGREMFGENFWVDLCLNKIKSFHAVISDVRFPNEADAIKARGGVVWRIVRPGVESVNKHASETSLDDYNFDKVIFNDGTLQDLHKLVDLVLSEKQERVER